MENKNPSSTTDEGLKEIDKQTNPVMYRMEMSDIWKSGFSLCIYVRLLRQ